MVVQVFNPSTQETGKRISMSLRLGCSTAIVFNENVPHGLRCLKTWSQLVLLFGWV